MTNESTQLLESFVEDSLVVGLTDEIVDKTIEIRRKSKIKMPEAIIAATAFACNSILITRNIRDFQNIEGLEFVNPYDV